MMSKYLHSDLSEKIIRCLYNVYDELGYGFLEKVYENSLLIEFEKNNIKAEAQKSIKVLYDGKEVGSYVADIVVEGKIIVELKSISKLMNIHEAQLLNYLKATKIKVGLLVNFGEKLEFKRKIF